jgi:hypothetical protein
MAVSIPASSVNDNDVASFCRSECLYARGVFPLCDFELSTRGTAASARGKSLTFPPSVLFCKRNASGADTDFDWVLGAARMHEISDAEALCVEEIPSMVLYMPLADLPAESACRKHHSWSFNRVSTRYRSATSTVSQTAQQSRQDLKYGAGGLTNKRI